MTRAAASATGIACSEASSASDAKAISPRNWNLTSSCSPKKTSAAVCRQERGLPPRQAPVWQRRINQGKLPRSARVACPRCHRPGSPLRFSRDPQESRFRHRRYSFACHRHRREHRHLLACQRRAPPAACLQGSATFVCGSRGHRLAISADIRMPVNPMHAREWAKQCSSLEQVALMRGNRAEVVAGGEPASIPRRRMFPTISSRSSASQPILGRTFLAEEEQEGNDRVVILSESLWRSRFQRRSIADRKVDPARRPRVIRSSASFLPGSGFPIPGADERTVRDLSPSRTQPEGACPG